MCPPSSNEILGGEMVIFSVVLLVFNIPRRSIARLFVKMDWKMRQNSYNSPNCQATYPYPQFLRLKSGFSLAIVFSPC